MGDIEDGPRYGWNVCYTSLVYGTFLNQESPRDSGLFGQWVFFVPVITS